MVKTGNTELLSLKYMSRAIFKWKTAKNRVISLAFNTLRGLYGARSITDQWDGHF